MLNYGCPLATMHIHVSNCKCICLFILTPSFLPLSLSSPSLLPLIIVFLPFTLTFNLFSVHPSLVLPPFTLTLTLLSFPSPSLSLNSSSPCFPYAQQWHELCKVASKTQWYRTDTKDGVTVSRCKFGRSHQHHAVIKVDGTIPHHPDTVAQFLQLSMKPGGKLDYLFRNETLVDHIDGMSTAPF